MSTRSVIARPLSDVGWSGNYHHFDGYPSGLGAMLWRVYHGHFGRDVDAMTAYLIDDHPPGWSFIQNTDLAQEPGFGNDRNAPACYCHGSRSENRDGSEDWTRTQIGPKITEHWDIEWVYVLHPRGMDVLAAHGGEFRHHAYVPWSGLEPDWESIDRSRPPIAA